MGRIRFNLRRVLYKIESSPETDVVNRWRPVHRRHYLTNIVAKFHPKMLSYNRKNNTFFLSIHLKQNTWSLYKRIQRNRRLLYTTFLDDTMELSRAKLFKILPWCILFLNFWSLRTWMPLLISHIVRLRIKKIIKNRSTDYTIKTFLLA